MSGQPERPEVLVVGGGPAGLATAIAARLAGLAVTVIDRGAPPIDKACGEGLMPDAVLALRELGVEIPAARSAPFSGIRYVDGERSAAAAFPHGHGLGVRRLALHEAFVTRAEEVGVKLCWGLKVEGIDGPLDAPTVRTATTTFAARWLVAADGLHSPLRRWAGLEGRQVRLARFGVRRHFQVPPWSPYVEVHWGPGTEAYVTPVGPEEVGVAFLWSGRKASFDDLMADLPALATRLAGLQVTSRDRGCGPLYQRVRAVHRGHLALVGDASGYLDAITGEGLAMAFHQAQALAAALAAGDLRLYGRAHRAISRLPNLMTGAVLFAERHPAIRRRMLAALAGDPALFCRLLGLHARSLRPRDLGVRGLLRLAKGLAFS